MRVMEREQEHYEVLEVPYGKVYSWCPESILIECDCGEQLTWRGGRAECRCGASYTDIEKEAPEQQPQENVYHPWLEDYEKWRETKIANGLQHEYYGFVEVNK